MSPAGTFKAFDADLSHGAMIRYYADYSQPVDLGEFESADQIAEETIASGHTTIVDLPAQASKSLTHWINESGLLEFADELGIRVRFGMLWMMAPIPRRF
jgi:hypothetical protein